MIAETKRPHVFTIVSDYFATGEGTCLSVMIVVTSPTLSREEAIKEALERFKRTFGAWYAQGAEVKDGIVDDEFGFMLSPKLKATLKKWTEDDPESRPGSLSYHAQLHFNFS